MGVSVARDATIRVEDFPFNRLTAEQRALAGRRFKLGIFQQDGRSIYRMVAYRWGKTDVVIQDPIFITANRRSWKYFEPMVYDPPKERHRVAQILANQADGMSWQLTRDHWKDRPAYIVANGPSATKARAMIPPKAEREGVVYAINGALEIVPDADVWVMQDTLWDVQRDAAGGGPYNCDNTAWGDYMARVCDLEAVEHALFFPYSSNRITRRVRPEARNYSMQAHGGFYRHLLDRSFRTGTPMFCETGQSLPTVFHQAWWLGAREFYVFGADQGIPPANRHLGDAGVHAGGVHPGQDGWWMAADDWMEVTPRLLPDGTPVKWLTKDPFIRANLDADAMAMWLTDAGCSFYNLSDGLAYAFIPFVDVLQPAPTVLATA